MKSIGEATHFLHTINIAHRDIKVMPHCVYFRQNLERKAKPATVNCFYGRQREFIFLTKSNES